VRYVRLSDESYAAASGRDFPVTVERVRTERDAIQASLNTPIELNYVAKVAYSDKTDRYMITFLTGDRTAMLKATPEVAEFVTAHLNETGTWMGRMEGGVLVDVNLIGA
jgi:hypothetical protein